jgi:hypothetical protein
MSRLTYAAALDRALGPEGFKREEKGWWRRCNDGFLE